MNENTGTCAAKRKRGNGKTIEKERTNGMISCGSNVYSSRRVSARVNYLNKLYVCVVRAIL